MTILDIMAIMLGIIVLVLLVRVIILKRKPKNHLYTPLEHDRYNFKYRYARIYDEDIKAEFSVKKVNRKDLNNQMGFIARLNRENDWSPYSFYINPDVDIYKLAMAMEVDADELESYCSGDYVSEHAGNLIESWLDKNLNGYFVTNKSVKDSLKEPSAKV